MLPTVHIDHSPFSFNSLGLLNTFGRGSEPNIFGKLRIFVGSRAVCSFLAMTCHSEHCPQEEQQNSNMMQHRWTRFGFLLNLHELSPKFNRCKMEYLFILRFKGPPSVFHVWHTSVFQTVLALSFSLRLTWLWLSGSFLEALYFCHPPSNFHYRKGWLVCSTEWFSVQICNGKKGLCTVSL